MNTSQITNAIISGNFSNDELNLVIEAVKFARGQNARKAARTLQIGDTVSFNGRNGYVTGKLESIKIKNAVVVSGFTRWKVPLSMLEAA
jgi:hypothetical protein